MRIGVDAMGGDYAPQIVIDAVKDIDIDVLLVGDKAQLAGKVPDSKIMHAPGAIKMNEAPQQAFRRKDSSIAVGIDLQKRGKIDAFVGAGNTGAYVMFSSLELGRIKGIRRPALGTFFPGWNGDTFVLDLGANVAVKPEDIYQFGVMGALCVEGITSKKNPSVALLSVGEEESKGSPLTKEAFNLLRKSSLNFVGNIEGHGIFEGLSDIVVCDGFVGNTILKLGESVIELTTQMIKDAINTSVVTKIGGLLLRRSLRNRFSRLRYQKYGGALLLGIKGVTIICHGRSNAEAIRNAIYTAARYVESGVNQRIEQFACSH
jgi:glycerol-3-phosphate acyltransferase PlsX